MTALAPVHQSVVTAVSALRHVVGAVRPSAVPSRPACLDEADRRLALYGWPQARAYRVYSVGDSLSGREEILFVTRGGKPFTARLGMVFAAGKRIEWLDVEAGW